MERMTTETTPHPIPSSNTDPNAVPVQAREFTFPRFPMEEPFCSVVLISDRCSAPELQPIRNYLSVIFPSDCSPSISLYAEKPFKNLMINWEDAHDWDETVAVKRIFDRYKEYHILSFGSYSRIPQTILSQSGVLIFDTEKDANQYLWSHRSNRIQNFTFDTAFLVVSKQGKDGEIGYLPRTEMSKYQK